MLLTRKFLTCLALLAAGSATFAQPGAVYVSGLAHTALGNAELGPADERRLPIRNLGSSGEDGVEISLRSAMGAGVAVDLTDFPGVGTPNREIKIRPKGWDGTVKGTMRAYNEPATGQTLLSADFTDIGASSALYTEYDSAGNPIAEGYLAAGDGFLMPPCVNSYQIWVAQLVITNWGPPKQFSVVWWYFCSSCPDPWQWYIPGGCSGISTERRFVITPIVPAGVRGIADIDSLTVTGADTPDLDGDGVSDMVVGNADLKSFSTPCPPWDCLDWDTAFHNSRWGIGQAHISETCTPDDEGGCDESDRRLVVDNLGSSGQDGVAFALPPNAGSVGAALAKGNCCRGHVIIMKLYDDEGQEQRVIRTQSMDPNDPNEYLDADFSALGANGFRLTLYGPSGGVVGPPDGTEIISGGPRPAFSGLCPPGAREWWINMGPPSNPVWVFNGCIGGDFYDFVLPGYGPVPNVASFRLEPLDATMPFGSRSRCEITSTDDQGLIIEDVKITLAITGDLDCDNNVGFGDINAFVKRLSNPVGYQAIYEGCPDTNGDINHDGQVDFGDINPFVQLLSGGA